MKSYALSFFRGVIFCLVLSLLGCSARDAGETKSRALGSAAEDSKAVDVRANFAPAVPERWTLPNGLTVMFASDNELPLVSGGIFTRGGALWESMDEFGVAAAMGAQMRAGGAGALGAEALDQRLEELSASISSSVGQEFGRVQFSGLSSDFEEVFDLFADVVRQPRFEEQRLSLFVDQTREAIRRRIDDPQTVASLSFNQILFGKTPYGWSLTTEDLRRFNRMNIVASHRRFIRPEGAILVVSGRVERAAVERKVRERFADWKSVGGALPPAPPPGGAALPGIYFIELPLTQATVIAGHRGVARLTPDHLAIEAFNGVFGGGGFGSRLMKRVRTEGGLAYSVYGAMLPAVTEGRNLIFLQTKSESTGIALLKAVSELELLAREPPSREELEETVSSLVNSFVFNFDSPGKVLSREATLELLRYPHDYDRKYIEGVQALRPVDVQQVARDHWRSEEMVVVIVGDAEARRSVELALRDAGGSSVVRGLQKLPHREVRFKERLVME